MYLLMRAAKSIIQPPQRVGEHDIFELFQVSEQDIPNYHFKKIWDHERVAVFEIYLPSSVTLEKAKQEVADCIIKLSRVKESLILIVKNKVGSDYIGGYLQSKKDYESVKHICVHVEAKMDEYPVLFFEEELFLFIHLNK